MKYTISLLFSILFSCSLFAQIPHTISYQGLLTDASGNPKPDGNYQFTFYLYETSSGGSSIWSEVKTLPVSKGLFSTSLGDTSPFGSSVLFDKPYWLGIKVETEPELTPRIAMTSSSYSFTTDKTVIPLNLEGTLNGSNYILTGYNHGTGHGIQGVSTSGFGTVGISTGTTGETIGVAGNSSSPDGYAVSGWNLATTGNSVGILGKTNSPEGTAVKGFGGSIGGDFSTGVNPNSIAAVRGTSNPGEGIGTGGYFTGGSVGVTARGLGGSSIGVVYGLFGFASGTAGTRVGVHGYATGGANNYAVYATGNLAYTGNLIGPSDIKLKQNISPFSEPLSILNKITQLEPKSYSYASEKFPQMNLPEGTHYGLIAQEVEKIFPELVVDAVHPTSEKNVGKDGEIHYKGLTYIEFIPILIQAIKEQQKEIEELRNKIEILSSK